MNFLQALEILPNSSSSTLDHNLHALLVLAREVAKLQDFDLGEELFVAGVETCKVGDGVCAEGITGVKVEEVAGVVDADRSGDGGEGVRLVNDVVMAESDGAGFVIDAAGDGEGWVLAAVVDV
jgi:hypothetical protein